MFDFIYFLFNFIAKHFVRWVINPGFYPSLFLLFVSTGVFLFFGHHYKNILTAQHFYQETVCTINADKSYKEELEKDCAVIQKDVFTGKKISTPCIPRTCYLYEVKYTVNNHNYISLGRYLESDHCGGAENEFTIGKNYFCWYDPKDPNVVLLDRGQSTLEPVVMMWCLLLMVWITYKNFISPARFKDTTIKPAYHKTDFISNLISIVVDFFLGGFVSLLFILLILAIIFPFLYLPYKTINYWRYHHYYIPSVCIVIDKKLGEWNSTGTKDYLPFLLLKYPVKNIEYFTWTSPISVYSDKNRQEKVLQKYPVNQQYDCWYNPDQPRDVILNRNFFYNLFH